MDFDIKPLQYPGGDRGIAVEGEIDLLAAPVLKQRLTEIIDGDVSFVLIDLSGATFVDSTTLGVLVGANKRLLLKDGGLMIICDSPNIRTIFTLTQLDRIFDIFESSEAALAALAALQDARAADSLA